MHSLLSVMPVRRLSKIVQSVICPSMVPECCGLFTIHINMSKEFRDPHFTSILT